jgi:glycine/D-amino acid oxidase-like deaminating enzyme
LHGAVFACFTSPMNASRREVLRSLAIAGAGLAADLATGCLREPGPARRRLPPVRVAADREIRTVVGLRPFRPSGFCVRADRVGTKLVVHNYGHGGSGVTMSWGTADLAARLALEAPARNIAVLGAGAVGLATARLLQLRGASVTIYAAALPPDTTSNIAGAQWFPFYAYDRGALVGAFRDQFLAAARFSYRWFQSLIGAHYGVRWMTNYSLGHAPVAHEDGLTGLQSPIRELIPELADLPREAHPFAASYVRRFDTMMIEPPIYLDAVLRDVRLAGGNVVVRRFDTVADLAALAEPTIINCTGLGARTLFGDDELTAIKGQLTVLLPQPEVDYAVLHDDLYMFSRSDGILLGGTHERGVYTLEPDLVAKQRVLAGHALLFAPLAAG